MLTADLLLVSVSSLGYNDLGFRNNNEIDTPHLDALALGGIVLDRYCTPTHLLLSLEIAARQVRLTDDSRCARQTSRAAARRLVPAS
jgi:hypothetical protein